MEEWKECRLVAGNKGVDREILYIDAMEVPDIIPWIKKNELMITTGYAMNRDEGVLLDIIKAMAKAGSSGIALKTKFFGEITQKIKDLANELQVPVIEVPRDMAFINLANPLMKKVVNAQNQKLEFNKAMNEKFLEIQIEGGGFQEICAVLGEMLGCLILVADHRQMLLGCYPEGEGAERWLAKNAYEDTTIQKQLKEYVEKSKDEIVAASAGEWEIRAMGIYVKNKCNGFLYAVGLKGKFDEMSEIALRQAGVYLALEFSKKGLVEQTEYYQDNNFFFDLISGNIQTEEDAVKRARGLKWPSFSYILVVGDIDEFEKVIRNKTEAEVNIFKDEIMQIHKDVLRRHRQCFFVGNKSDSFHCLFTKDIEKSEILKCMKEIQRQIYKNYGAWITIGVSTEIFSYHDFIMAYKKARTAITIGKKRGKREICFIEDLRLEEAFFEMAKMDIFREFVDETLLELKMHDEKYGTPFLETLKTLAEHHGARKETAETLFLHRNTLAYRIRRIEQLTGADLNDPDVLFQVNLVMKILAYMES
ncbi:hypothetical protein HFM87_17095 [Blautia producta]|nr:hypothetical protein [Blautia producta]NSG17564.1 hypothetical protein [Blautia producta]NSJ77742.1 hypothetical protein [Blautia producta]